METPAPGSGGTPSTENNYVIKPTNIGETSADPAVPAVNTEVTTPTGGTVTPPKNVSEDGLPTEPFEYVLPSGQRAGAMYTDPQYQVGTLQYTVRTRSEGYKNSNRKLFSNANFASTAYDPNNPAGKLPDISEPVDGVHKGFADFINNIRSTLPEGKNTADDAAWYILNVERPRTDHDSRYVFGKIRPLVKTLVEKGRRVGDLSEKDLIDLAKTAAVDPSIVNRLIAEQTEERSRKQTDTYTMQKLRHMVDMLDPRMRQGQLVASNPSEHLFPLTGLARRDAWLAFVDWKDQNGPRFLRGITEGVSHLIVEAGYGIGGVAEGTVGTIVSAGSLGNVMMQNNRFVLSDTWMMKTPEERDEANQVLIRADEFARKFGDEYVNETSDGRRAAMIQEAFGEFADPKVIATFRRLKELKEAGAYRNQYSAERLANFGEGVIQAIPNLVSFFTDSVDPNSFLFRSEASLKTGENPMAADPLFGPAFQAFRGASVYHDMTGQELDENIRIWEENYNATAVKSDPMVARMYDAIGFKEAANAARSQLQEPRLQAAGGLADPITLTIGTMKLLGVGADAAKAAMIADKYAKEIKAIASEVNAARIAAGTGSKAYDTAVATLKTKLEALFGGIKLTDDDVVGIVLTGGRSGAIADTAAAKLIRRETGRRIAQNDVLAARARKVQELLDSLPDAATGATPAAINATRARLVAGAGLTAAGVASEATGGAFNWVADFLEEARKGGAVEGNVIKRGVHKFLNWSFKQPILAGASTAVTTAAVTHLISQGDIFAAGLAGAVGVSPSVLVRAEFLKAMGTNVAQYGRIQQALGATTTEGSRYGGSIFVRAAMDMENRAVQLSKSASAGEAATKAKIAELAEDAAWLRRAQKSGLEDVVRNSTRVVYEDGVVGGGVGAFLAWMNDRDAAGSGAGIGMGVSLSIRAANRLYSMTPSGAQPVLDKVVLADLATMLEMPSERGGIDPSSRARVFEYLDGSKKLHPNDEAAASREYIKRAQIIRDLVITHRGQVSFTNAVEFEASLVLTNNSAAEATQFIREARKRHPNDPDKAAAFAAELAERAKATNAARDLATSLTNDIAIQEQKLNKRKSDIANGKAEVVKLEAEVAKLEEEAKFAAYGTFDPKTIEAANVKLQRALENQSRLEAEATLLETEIGQLKTNRNKAQNDAGNPAPLRPFETRATVDGNRARKVANGFYIVDGPQGRRTVIDINNIDNLGAISEGWHALLQDAAVQDLMPDMVRMMFGEEVAQGGQGRSVAYSPEVTEALINAYAADMPPEMKAKFLTEYQNGKDLYQSSGGKDVSGLIGPTEEILTWFMATIDGNKRTAYRPGLATPDGAAASASRRPGEAGTPGSGIGSAISESGRGKSSTPIGWSELSKLLFGDRMVSDEVTRAARFMFDPDSGMFTRRSAEHMKAQLERSGMRFIEGGDGTLRGYFINNKNEIIRNPVLNEFYDRVITLTNGRANRRTKPVNMYDPLIPLEQRIDIVRANGMDWMLTPDGKNIHTPERVAQISDAFTRDLVDSLAAIPENQRGMLTYHDPANPTNTTLSGIPSDADMAAVANNTKLPKTVRENLLMLMESMASGDSTKTVIFDYNNIFSVNTEALTEARLRIGQDIDGKMAIRRGNPMSILIEDVPVYGKDGKVIRIDDPSKPGSKKNLTQKAIKIQFFGPDEFIRTSNRFFEEGLWYRDKDGNKVSRIKDPKGIDYTPDYLIQLFGSKEGFQDKATLYLQHLWKAGPIDPYAPTPTRVTTPTAELLDPTNPERGAAMRDAMRVFFGTEPGQKRTPWVQANVNTNVVGGFAIRGKDYPIWTARLDQAGPMKFSGESFFMTQRAFSSSQFAMSIKDWGRINVPQVQGRSQMTINAVSIIGSERNNVSLDVEKVLSHPVLNDVKLFVGNTKGEKAYAYTMGDGNIRHIRAKNQAEALEVVRTAIGTEMEWELFLRESFAGVKRQNEAAKQTVTLRSTLPSQAETPKPVQPTAGNSINLEHSKSKGWPEFDPSETLSYSHPDPAVAKQVDNIFRAISDMQANVGKNESVAMPLARSMQQLANSGVPFEYVVSKLDTLGIFPQEGTPAYSRIRDMFINASESTYAKPTVSLLDPPSTHNMFYTIEDNKALATRVYELLGEKPDKMVIDQLTSGFTKSVSKQIIEQLAESGGYDYRMYINRMGEMLKLSANSLTGDARRAALVRVERLKRFENLIPDAIGMDMAEQAKYVPAQPKKGSASRRVTVSDDEIVTLAKPFKELDTDRHGWQDDAMITPTGYIAATETQFALTQFGMDYQAHGMTKSAGPNTALKNVLRLFAEGIDPEKNFYTAPYRLDPNASSADAAGAGAGLGTSSGEAIKDGPITLVSKPGKMGSNTNMINTIDDIAYVVVNDGAFLDPDAAVKILADRLPKRVQVFKMSEEAKFLTGAKDTGVFQGKANIPEPKQKPILMTYDEAMPPGMNKQEAAKRTAERDRLVAALRDEDPAVIEEERKRITGERIKRQIELALNQRAKDKKAIEKARGSELVAETAADVKAQEQSDKGWAVYAEGHEKRQAAKLKAFTDEQNAAIRQVWEAEENAISLIEQERAKAIKEAQDKAKSDARAAAEAQRAAERLDAIITARQRALRDSVEKVLSRQSKDKAARDAGMEKLVDEFFASNEPAVAPGLLRISSDQMLTTLHRVAYDPATGIAISPYTGAPLVGMPAKPGTFSKPFLTSRYNVADRPYPMTPRKDAPWGGPEWTKFTEEATIWRRAFQARQQSKFEAAFPNRSEANAKIGYANEGPVKAQGIVNDIQDKIWITDGGVRLVREFKKADAASKGGLQYRVYGANGMQVYAGTSAEAAREAGERLDQEIRLNAGSGRKPKAGLPKTEPQRTEEGLKRSIEFGEALNTPPANAKDTTLINVKERELRNATEKYNR